jgi:hypothetical protein
VAAQVIAQPSRAGLEADPADGDRLQLGRGEEAGVDDDLVGGATRHRTSAPGYRGDNVHPVVVVDLPI